MPLGEACVPVGESKGWAYTWPSTDADHNCPNVLPLTRLGVIDDSSGYQPVRRSSPALVIPSAIAALASPRHATAASTPIKTLLSGPHPGPRLRILPRSANFDLSSTSAGQTHPCLRFAVPATAHPS